ncbi:MAG: hypothetical protein AAFU49_12415 [Pseudomonadota bacterium]
MTDFKSTHRFYAKRIRAWGQMALGWICAQSLLTLLLISPPGWGTAFLLVTGGAFALWTLRALRLVADRRPVVEIGPNGLRPGLDASTIKWDTIEAVSVEPDKSRITLFLLPGRTPWWWFGRRSAVLDMRGLDGSLTDLEQAVRDERPDLELPA